MINTKKGLYNNSQLFIDAIRDDYLHQHVTQPTRYRHGQNPHLLDLILTSSEDLVTNIEYNAGLGLSDHLVLSCNLMVKQKRLKDEISRLNFNKGNYEVMNKLVSDTDWTSILQDMTTEEAWLNFSSALTGHIEKQIPKSVPRKNKRHKIWMTKELTAKHRMKQRAWKKYKDSGDRWDYIRATNEKNEFTMMARNLCRDFEYNLARNVKQNPKAFWRYCKSKLKNRGKLGDLKSDDGTLTNDDRAKADLLNKYFVSVFTNENISHIPDMAPKYITQDNLDVIFTTDVIEKKLRKLKVNKSAGPDGYHPRVLSELHSSIKSPLSIICTKSYAEGHLPDE